MCNCGRFLVLKYSGPVLRLHNKKYYRAGRNRNKGLSHFDEEVGHVYAENKGHPIGL